MIVNSEFDNVEVHVFDRPRGLFQSDTLSVMTWEEDIRDRNMVLTPLITRAGAAVSLQFQGEQRIGCLIPLEGKQTLLHADTCSYQALVTKELDVAEILFLDVLNTALIPLGEILYLDMSVLEDERFRSQGAGGKVLFTRLNVPHVRAPQVGKLYVTCLHQPRTSRGKSTRSATSMTLAVNPWDVQLASLYTGSPALVLKHLQ